MKRLSRLNSTGVNFVYISRLCQVGYKIEFVVCANKNCLFGANTLDKKIFLYNLNPNKSKDWERIEDLLRQADSQYCTEWRKD